MPDLDVERELDELYGAPLDQFTRARNELARRLKDAGEPDAAADVRGLGKPSVAVWTVNQLARREAAAMRRLLAAGAQMREGQRRALAGESPETLERAAADERDAIAALARAARGVLEDAGRPASPGTVDRVATTLRAAAVDEEAATLLERGRLAEELEPAGFGALAGMPVSPRRSAPPPRRREQPPRPDPAERRQRVAEARDELKRAREVERSARREAKQAHEAAERAERGAAEAAEAVRAAEAAVEQARGS